MTYRSEHLSSEGPHTDSLLLPNNMMKSKDPTAFWLQGFVLEVRTSPDSLYQLCCGLQRALRNANQYINQFEGLCLVQFVRFLMVSSKD